MSSVDVSQRQVKSTERVRDLGEVFTPSNTVQEMLNMLPERIWGVHPSPSFLEPSCGDGNFLVAILDRKLQRISDELELGRLPAGNSEVAAQYHALEAISSIYAVDISVDNVIGGRPGHEIGARTRLLDLFIEWHDFEFAEKPDDIARNIQSASWIVQHNILVGNMLPLDADGKSTQRDNLPIIEYQFDPSNQSVTLLKCTLGDVLENARTEIGDDLMLFGAAEPTVLWTGNAFEIFDAEQTLAPRFKGPVRNGPKRV
ncbi:hypothetical protein MCEMRE130_00107 [Candidatus Nanopelagicaceae bacterium]